MIRSVLGLCLALVLVGCKSRPLGPYVSPRVTGQVVSADELRPLAGVSVIRGPADPNRGSPPKGAELLMRKAPVRTDENGRFESASERVLSVVRGSGWNVVSLSFERMGYHRFQTNCQINAVTKAANGELVLDVGRIFLQPVSK
jgi:hypothetical protein